MSNLKYDCDLEYSAFDTALMCKSPKKYSFSDVGSNFATHPLTRPASLHNPATKQEIMKWFEDIDEIIEKWWSTATKSDPLVDYKPQEGNEPMIPFLQVNGKLRIQQKSVVAYNVCDNSDPPTSSPYVVILFVNMATSMSLNNMNFFVRRDFYLYLGALKSALQSTRKGANVANVLANVSTMALSALEISEFNN
ncbi:hypothetical protein KIN20_025351 [Parelaphostrongylus tenuis]|uniref:Uncharacterized protein n=1 Tax=Parelaphostrongylus tenuis TaxID=148309 RepID=A0AAD5QWK9_PARTN|nr:hypothetical protein KIN20_025351 [Parelaphostrongylus tenuis]